MVLFYISIPKSCISDHSVTIYYAYKIPRKIIVTSRYYSIKILVLFSIKLGYLILL